MERHSHAMLQNLAYDYAVDHPGGFTLGQLADHLDVSVYVTRAVVRGLRRALSEDSINLPCDPPGYRGPWVYHLASTTEQAGPWEINRLGDAETRLETILSVATSVKRGSDGRSKAGKKARAIEVGLRHLLENLELVENEFESR